MTSHADSSSRPQRSACSAETKFPVSETSFARPRPMRRSKRTYLASGACSGSDYQVQMKSSVYRVLTANCRKPIVVGLIPIAGFQVDRTASSHCGR